LILPGMRGCKEAFRYRRIILHPATRTSTSDSDMIKEAHPLLARAADLAEHVTWDAEQEPCISRELDVHVSQQGTGL
jgi:hypothetical protein